jgi:hypothetical protein
MYTNFQRSCASRTRTKENGLPISGILEFSEAVLIRVNPQHVRYMNV